MNDNDANPINTEIKVCPELRDKIFEFLPTQAKRTLIGAEVKFWPNNHGEMELRIRYDATDNLLDIDAIESIYGPSGRITGDHIRGCELDSETGDIHAYAEFMVAPGATTPLEHTLLEAEDNITRFDKSKLDFLMGLFDSL